MRFVQNCKAKRKNKPSITGSLSTGEIEKSDKCLIRTAQLGVLLENKVAQQLGLTRCEDFLRCVGRMSGFSLIFISRESMYALRLEEEIHI